MSARGLDESLAPDRRGKSRGALTTGNKAIYPGQGPCRIGRVVKRVVDASVMMFYHLTVLDDNRGDLFVPPKAHNRLSRLTKDDALIRSASRQPLGGGLFSGWM